MISETVFLDNLYNVKIENGQNLINTDFQVIDITFYQSNKPNNANRVYHRQFLDDSQLN